MSVLSLLLFGYCLHNQNLLKKKSGKKYKKTLLFRQLINETNCGYANRLKKKSFLFFFFFPIFILDENARDDQRKSKISVCMQYTFFLKLCWVLTCKLCLKFVIFKESFSNKNICTVMRVSKSLSFVHQVKQYTIKNGKKEKNIQKTIQKSIHTFEIIANISGELTCHESLIQYYCCDVMCRMLSFLFCVFSFT